MPRRHALDRDQLLEHYGAYLLEVRHCSPRTWRDYRRTLEQFWTYTGKAPARCTAADLRRFLRRRATPGGNSRGLSLADSTQHTYAAYICTFYRVAYARRWLASDPMRDVALPPLPLAPPRALELADVARLMRAALGDRRDLVLIWLAYGCGLRCVEIARLRREDLHLGARPRLVVLGKGNRNRTVPLNRRVAEVLRVELAGGPTVGPVITSQVRPGQPITAKTVSHLLSAALRRAELSATGHQLRHTFATELLAAGGGRNFRAVQKLLGHARASSTERYVSAYDQDSYDAVELLPDPERPPSVGPVDVGPAAPTGGHHRRRITDRRKGADRRRGPSPGGNPMAQTWSTAAPPALSTSERNILITQLEAITAAFRDRRTLQSGFPIQQLIGAVRGMTEAMAGDLRGGLGPLPGREEALAEYLEELVAETAAGGEGR